MPLLYGSVTPSAAAVATAASAALPPRRSTASPMRVASGSTELTAPPLPTTVARFGGAVTVVRTGAGRDAPGWVARLTAPADAAGTAGPASASASVVGTIIRARRWGMVPPETRWVRECDAGGVYPASRPGCADGPTWINGRRGSAGSRSLGCG